MARATNLLAKFAKIVIKKFKWPIRTKIFHDFSCRVAPGIFQTNNTNTNSKKVENSRCANEKDQLYKKCTGAVAWTGCSMVYALESQKDKPLPNF